MQIFWNKATSETDWCLKALRIEGARALILKHHNVWTVGTRAVRRQIKRRQKRRLLQAPQAPFKALAHSKCCIGGFRETGLALVIVLRCNWPLCDIWFKSYEHFTIKMFLSVHTAGLWWIFQPKFYTFRVKSAPFKKAPGKKRRRICAF